jgi:hypothetical protein
VRRKVGERERAQYRECAWLLDTLPHSHTCSHTTSRDPPTTNRAPVLVAIALIENGETPLLAVDFIRKARRGAINKVQLDYLRKYKKSGGCIVQ